MYPKNAASPEPIAIGAVVQISDGAVQTSGCTVRIIKSGVAEGDGGGTTAYSADGVVLYTPTQAETNYASFILIAKKTGCIPVAVTVVPTLSATAGQAVCADTQKVDVNTIKTQAVTCAAGVTVNAYVGAAAAPGAANGHVICGTNAPITITGSGDALTIASTGANGVGMKISGNGTGAGFSATGGATGPGMLATGGGNNSAADGFRIAAGGALADGFDIDRFHVTGTTTLTGAVALSNTLTVTGATTLTGAVTATNASNDINGCNVQKIDDQSVTASGGITVNTNLGTTQPVGFTGTGASALVKSDMVDVAGAAVSTSTAQIGVNAVQAGGTAWGSGAVTAGSIATGAITNAKFAAGAIDAAAIADNAIDFATFAADCKTGSGLKANVESVSANALTASALATDAVNEIVDQVWNETLSDHLTAGSTGAGLNAAGSAGDPWSTALPGAYGAGTAGKIVGEYINAPVGTIDVVVDAIAAELAKVPKSDSIVSFNNTALAAIADAVHDEQVDGTVTARQSIRLQNSAAAGKLSGAATTNVKIRDLADTKDRIDATVDSDGNRTAVTTTLT